MQQLALAVIAKGGTLNSHHQHGMLVLLPVTPALAGKAVTR